MKRKLLALTIGLLVTGFIEAQPVIQANPTSACYQVAGVTVLFSSPGASTYSWNFGDPPSGSNTSTASNPSHIYFQAGTYTVTLTTNTGVAQPITITIYPTPVADFVADDSLGCFPLNVNFRDKSTSPNSTIINWRWDYGDGNIDSLIANPSHTYGLADPTGFPVTLQVFDKNGCSSTKVKLGYIKIPDGVSPSFKIIASQGCKIPITVNLNNTSIVPPGSPFTYLWNFGDGSATSNITSPSHTYTAGGNYTIKLVVASQKGCSDSLSIVTPIIAGNVTSNFSAPDSVCVNSVITFQNTSAPQPTVSNWDFGDGTTSNQITNISKSYASQGNYNVKLTNTFGACIDSVIKPIAVLTPAVANFSAGNTVSCDSLFTVSFTNQSTNATIYFWSFGDGTTSNLPSPTHTYVGYGTYTVTLQASNAAGCSGTITKTGLVKTGKPFVQISNQNSSGCAPFTFSPIIIDSAVDGVSGYSWDFGDGTTSNSASPTHLYNNPGTYFVKLSITTNGGCSASTIDTVKVGTIKPVVNFTALPTPVCVNTPVIFTDNSSNNPDQWLWLFGDGTSSHNKNTTHNYSTPGNFTVTLIAYNNGCNDSSKKPIVVNLPMAKFGYDFSCSGGSTAFNFHDSSIGADTWSWDFGDGNTSNMQNPVHNYAVAKTYNVSLTVTNLTSGCSNTYSDSVSVTHQTGTLVLSANNICINNSIFATAVNTDPSLINSYNFFFGDGTSSGPAFNTVSQHAYDTSGSFNVYVVLNEKSGCTDTLVPKPIQVSGPKAQFTVSGSGVGCNGLVATFIDQSKTDGIHSIVKWIWDFGDGTPPQTFAGPPFTHAYFNQGIYTVKLKVIDASGCYDTLVKNNLIIVASPTASIGAIDSLSCPGSPIQFINNSKGYGLTYTWNFGNGDTSNLINPGYTYPIGTYTVSLKVVDQYGCTASVGNYNVRIDTPYAAFTLLDTFASCPPLTANFIFTGSYYKSIRWDFGDGGISNLLDPTHFYTIPGTYTASLIVTSHGGCTDTAPTRTITILGPYGAFNYSPLQGCHILPVNFTLTTSDNVVQYTWVFDTLGHTITTTVPDTAFTYDSIGRFVPRVILENSSGCQVPVFGKDTIRVIGSKPKFIVDDTVLCDKGTVHFTDITSSKDTVGALSGYFWDFGDGSTSTLQNPPHFYSSPGIYSVKFVITMQPNCADSIIMNNLIKVVASPSISISGDVEKCAPASMNFQGNILIPDTSAFKWHWDFANGKIDSVQNPPTQLYPNPGIDTVKLTATNSSKCSTTVSSVIKIDSVAMTNAGPDTAICVGQNASLHASSNMSPVTYNWLPPTNGTLSCTACSNPIANPITTTTYYVQGVNSSGCGTIDSVVVIVVQPATMNVTPLADSICLGQNVQLIASGEKIYSWTPANSLSNPSIPNPFANPDTTTTYQVTGSDSIFCFLNTQSVKISVFKYPTIDIGPGTVTIPVGNSYQITGIGSSDIDSINWSPTIGLTCIDCLSPIASPVSTTTYSIRVENNGGCVTTASVKIIVTCDGKNIFVANTFSPNGDGQNDWFYVQGKGLSTIQSMRVFNRWGQLVFEKKDFAPNVEQNGWDGTFNGKKAPVDVYIYTIEVICQNSQVVAYNGNVALIR